MIISITLIELRSPWQFFRLSLHGLRIFQQLDKTTCLAKKNTGFWKTHYTMTAWESQADIAAFYKSGSHLEAMKESKILAEYLRFITFEAEKMPDWKEAKEKVQKEGRLMQF
jgi:hypothetical protein